MADFSFPEFADLSWDAVSASFAPVEEPKAVDTSSPVWTTPEAIDVKAIYGNFVFFLSASDSWAMVINGLVITI